MTYFDEVLIVSKAFKDFGAKILDTTQDGSDDAVKIQLGVHGSEFEVSIEAVDNLIIMYPDSTFTYNHKSAAEAHTAMLKWE